MNEESKVSKAQQRAVHKYVKANYDRLDLTMPKGRKEELKAHRRGAKASTPLSTVQLRRRWSATTAAESREKSLGVNRDLTRRYDLL